MKERWNIQIWGTRGSFPAVGADFQAYGGNTSCISVDTGDALVVLDAGSGLVSLGEALLCQNRKRADILISHLHLDHIMGLFPFPPLHDRQAKLHLYGSPNTVRELAHLVEPPLWPVGLTDCQASVQLHEVWAGRPFSLAGGAAPGLTLSTMGGSHPGGCAYFRMEREGRSLVYALDCELAGETAPRLTEFAREADLLVWDASFVPGAQRPGWGHSTWEEGAALGRAAGVKQVLMTHYSSGCTDGVIQKQERLALESDRRCVFAREGMVIRL